MSQADIAKASGVSREYIARLELGQQDPTRGTMQKLARALKVKVGMLVECDAKGGTSTVQNAPVYKPYRIHTTRLTFGTYISMIVSVGKRQLLTENSLTDTVLRVPGEFFSKEEAFLAAKLYIDAEDSRRQA